MVGADESAELWRYPNGDPLIHIFSEKLTKLCCVNPLTRAKSKFSLV